MKLATMLNSERISPMETAAGRTTARRVPNTAFHQAKGVLIFMCRAVCLS